MKGEDWRHRGNCAPVNYLPPGLTAVQALVALGDLDAAMFPASGAGSTSREDRLRAHAAGKAICRGCPVVQQCLDDALAAEGGGGSGRWGVRGGLAPDERAELWRRSRRRTP